MTDWMTLPELAEHSRLSVRTLKRAIARRRNRLPSHKVEGRRLVRRIEYDAWATARETRKQEIVSGLHRGCKPVSQPVPFGPPQSQSK
jgi:hypothetical protein